MEEYEMQAIKAGWIANGVGGPGRESRAALLAMQRLQDMFEGGEVPPRVGVAVRAVEALVEEHDRLRSRPTREQVAHVLSEWLNDEAPLREHLYLRPADAALGLFP